MIYDLNFDSSNLHQCDIFDNIYFNCFQNEIPAILLTPECDLILQEGRKLPKAKYLKFVAILPFDDILNNLLSQTRITKKQKSGDEYLDQDTYNDFILLLKQFLNRAIFPRYYYMPPLPDYFYHSIIDFQILEIKKYSQELINELINKKISNILSSWKESIPVQYANYSSRIGTKDLSEQIIDMILTDYEINFNIS